MTTQPTTAQKTSILPTAKLLAGVVGFITFINLGVLAPLNTISIEGWPIPKIALLTCLAIGAAIVTYEVWTGTKTAEDGLTTGSGLFSLGGVDIAAPAHFVQDAISTLVQKLPFKIPVFKAQATPKLQPRGFRAKLRNKIQHLIHRNLPVTVTTVEVADLPTPVEVARALRGNYYAFLADIHTEDQPAQVLQDASRPLTYLPARPATSEGLQPIACWNQRRGKILVLLLGISLIASAIAWLLITLA